MPDDDHHDNRYEDGDELVDEDEWWSGESERDAAVRDTNHVVELQSLKADSMERPE